MVNVKFNFLIIGLILSSFFISGCNFLEPININDTIFKDYSKHIVPTQIEEDKEITKGYDEYNPQTNNDDFVIGSFNIQVFGKKKANSNIMPYIKDIIDDYDIIAIQEVRDASGTVISKLNDIQGFNIKASPRLGRSSSKEQYIFMYSDRVIPEKALIYPDKNDVFEREPYIMSFMINKQNITFIQIHIKPLDAEQEIRELENVVNWSLKEFGNDNIYILGDLNADGIYFNSFDYLKKNYQVLIDEDVDTTVARDDCCAYDRILSTEKDDNVLFVGVDNLSIETNGDLELIKALSDHYPIFMVYEQI